jgi:hypothetical protein
MASVAAFSVSLALMALAINCTYANDIWYRNRTYSIFLWHNSPQWARTSSFMMILRPTTLVVLLWGSDQHDAETST